MEYKSIAFAPDILIAIDDNKVAIKGQGINSYINSENLDSFSYTLISQRKFGLMGLWFRYTIMGGLIGLCLIIMEAIFLDTATSIVAMFITGWIIGGIAPALGFLIALDIIIGTGISTGIMDKHYSVQAYKATIANKSGNNIDFYAALADENKLIGLRKDVELIKVNKVSQTNISSDLDGVRKLDSLLKDGIITRDEFDLKKKQLLGL